MIKLKGVCKSYPVGDRKVEVLKNINMNIEEGEFVCIYGKSGCGKSTLLNIIGLMDRMDAGEYFIDDLDVGSLGRDKQAALRSDTIGFIFQAFHLIPDLNVFENVVVPLGYRGVPKKDRKKRGEELLGMVGLQERKTHYPSQLSGGEQQRTAIARALAANPRIIVADEPTGNLDSQNGKIVMDLLKGLNEKGITIIVVTHDISLESYASKVITLSDGEIINDSGR